MDVLSLSLGSTGLLTAVFVFLSVIYYVFSKKSQENNAPPSCKGWIPWLGCAFDFGVAPLGFIDKKRREVCKLCAIIGSSYVSKNCKCDFVSYPLTEA